MRNSKILAAGVLIISCLLVACSTATGTTTTKDKYEPAVVEKTESGTVVTLDEKAAVRLGIQTAAVADAGTVREGSSGALAVPYSAILYDKDGNAFVYTNPGGLTFVRAPITVDYVEGDQAILSAGPSSGTEVVAVGVAELWGAETGLK
jgi:uncharacterized protein YcfL